MTKIQMISIIILLCLNINITYAQNEVNRIEGDTITLESTLIPGIRAADFGNVIDIQGTTALITANRDSEKGTNSGAVYIYELEDGLWIQKHKLWPDDILARDQFGISASFHNNTILVGAPFSEDDDSSPIIGSAYIFKYDGSSWVQTQRLIPSDPIIGDTFGMRVSLYDDIAIIWAPASFAADNNYSPASREASVYVFEFDGESWQQTAKLVDDIADGLFGFYIAVSENRIAVLDFPETGTSAPIMIYEKVNGNWINTKVISEVEEYERFSQIAFHNNDLIAGAISTDFGHSGSVYTYSFDNMDWVVTNKVTPDSQRVQRLFGSDFDINDNNLIVRGFAPFISSIGSFFLYKKVASNWHLLDTLAKDNTPISDIFGEDAKFYGDNNILISSIGRDNHTGGVDAYSFINTSPFEINSGLNGAWFEQETSGQGMLLEVLPEINKAFLAWFTYDNEITDPETASNIGHAGQKWLTGLGDINMEDKTITFDINLTSDGLFDNSRTVINSPAHSYATVVMSFENCSHAIFEYDFLGQDITGSIDLGRITSENNGLCEDISFLQTVQETPQKMEDFELNQGVNGAWFNPETAGQGVLIELLPDRKQMFFAWFTYDTVLPDADITANIGAPGQRWLTGLGTIDQDTKSVTFDVNMTSNGLFDNPQAVTTTAANSYGTFSINFEDCANASASYDLFEQNLTGVFPLVRIASDNDQLCSLLNTIQP
jgi:hypothetical protein